MKLFSRLTNSYVMTATLLVVIIGSLCFSVGEGLRLRPFPDLAHSQVEDSGAVKDAGESNQFSLAKYGPLDVPTQVQKRSKRHALELASGTSARTQSAFEPTTISFNYEPFVIKPFRFVASRLGRAPPLNT